MNDSALPLLSLAHTFLSSPSTALLLIAMIDAQEFCLQCGCSLQVLSPRTLPALPTVTYPLLKADFTTNYCSQQCSSDAKQDANPSTTSPSRSPRPPRTTQSQARPRAQRTIRARVISSSTLRAYPRTNAIPAVPKTTAPEPTPSTHIDELVTDLKADEWVGAGFRGIDLWVADVQKQTQTDASESTIRPTTSSSFPTDWDTSSEWTSDTDAEGSVLAKRPMIKSRHSCPADMRSSHSFYAASPAQISASSALAPALADLTPSFAIMSPSLHPHSPATERDEVSPTNDLTPPAAALAEYHQSQRALALALEDMPYK